jgi:hypothetical protein
MSIPELSINPLAQRLVRACSDKTTAAATAAAAVSSVQQAAAKGRRLLAEQLVQRLVCACFDKLQQQQQQRLRGKSSCKQQQMADCCWQISWCSSCQHVCPLFLVVHAAAASGRLAAADSLAP